MSESLLCNGSDLLTGVSRFGLFPFGYLAHHYGGIPDSMVFTLLLSIVLFFICHAVWCLLGHFLHGTEVLPKMLDWDKLNQIFTTEWLLFHISTVIKNYGLRGMQALLFERYLTLLMVVYCFLTLIVTLPINIYYGKNHHPDEFESGILVNVRTSQVLWVHVILGWIYLPISLLMMKHYWNTAVLPFAKSDDGMLSRDYTLQVQHIPYYLRTRENLKDWFSSHFPGLQIKKVYLTFDTRKLHDLKNLQGVLSEVLSECDGHTLKRCCCCFCLERCGHYNKTPIEYYQELLEATEKDIQITLTETFNKPLGIAFITVHDPEKHVIKSLLSSIDNSDKSKISLDAVDIKRAPPSTTIRWTKLYKRKKFLVKFYVVHTLLFLFLVFLTSPQAFVEQFEVFVNKYQNEENVLNTSGFLLTFGEDVLKFFIQLIVSLAVAAAIKYLGYWKEEVLNRILLRYVTFYTMGTVIIGPTLEFFTIKAVVMFGYAWFKEGFIVPPDIREKWNCVFLAKGGLHYVDLILIGAFMGNMFEICQFKELYFVGLDFLRSKTVTEMKVRGRKRIFEHWPGEIYAKSLFYTIAVISLSLSTPLITPFGAAFVIIRHIVLTLSLWRTKEQNVNITTVDNDFMRTVVGLVSCGPLVLQWYTWFFLNLRSGTRTIDLISGLLAISSSLFVAVCATFDWTYPVVILKPLPQRYTAPGPYYPQYIKEEYIQIIGDPEYQK